MNSTINWRQLKSVLLIPSLFTMLLAGANTANAGTIQLKNTSYGIPRNAYFVSPNGRNSNSGKSPSAPTTVERAIAIAPRGATIVFRGGVYRNVSAKIDKRVTLQPFPREQVWIKGSVVVDGWAREGNKWRKDGWNYSFPQNMSSRYLDSKYRMAGHRDMVYVNGTALKQVGSKNDVGPGEFYVDARRNHLYIGSNPGGRTVEATTQEEGLKIVDDGVTIRGLGFAHYAEKGVYVVAPHATLENNTFSWNGIEGVRFGGTSSTDGVVRGNTFSYNGRSGLRIMSADRIVLENNTISDNNVERFSLIWDAAGVKITETHGLTWRNNLVQNNMAHGMWVDLSSTKAVIVNNVARGNEGAGIMFEVSHDAIIAGNVSYKNGAGILVSNSSNARVYNNSLADNGWNLRVKDTKRTNRNRRERAAGITWVTRNVVVKNNILSNANGVTYDSTLFEASNCDTREPSSMMLAADANAYYRRASRNPAHVLNWSIGRSRCSMGIPSIATLRSMSGFERNGMEISNVANPFFVNESRGDFRLRSNSPAIGRGVPLPSDVARAIGVAPGRRVDLGALQSRVFLFR